jgi:hypothetical protein
MQALSAVKVAVDLLHVPSQVRRMRGEPPPEDVSTLLHIAAGDEGALSEAAARTGRQPDLIRAAAAFYIEQILLRPNADSYQTLGGKRSFTTSELRRNMALLLRWLHPDKDPRGQRSIFAGRVTAAWEDLKTPERRATYDAFMSSRDRKLRSRRSRRGKPAGTNVVSLPKWPARSAGILQRTLAALRRVLN